MSDFSSGSALEPKVQFEYGFDDYDKVGIYIAPSTAYDEGTLMKLSSDGATLEVCGTNDAKFILEQPVAQYGAIDSATNREKYLSGIPQKSVGYADYVTVVPKKKGGIIKTSVIATGSETGAITAGATTPGSTEVESYNGEWRILQGGNVAEGQLLSDPDTDGFVRILLY
jgi:hypothetical protein